MEKITTSHRLGALSGLLPWLRADIGASIVVFLVALPLSMGVAIASGVPPVLGLVSAIVGGLLVGLFAGSPLQVSGPAAGLAVLVFELVRTHGLAALGPVVLLAGLLQMLAGALRVGGWFRAASPAVVQGMLAGIGVIIVASQLHIMLDMPSTGHAVGDMAALPGAVVAAISGGGWVAGLLALGTLGLLLGWERWRPERLRAVPGALIAVVGASLAGLGLDVATVALPRDILGGISVTTLDGFWGVLTTPSLLGAAMGLAVVASAEALLSATAVDQLHNGPRTRYDRELVAQGVGNLVSGLLGALPVTGVIVRSSANVSAGARSRASAMFHAVWLLGLAVFAPFVLELVPTAALAAILVHVGIKLADPRKLIAMWHVGRWEAAIFATTLGAIVATDLLTGVVLGFGLATARLVFRLAALHIDMEHEVSDVLLVRLSGVATFLNVPRLAAMLDALPHDRPVSFDLARLAYIDHAALELIRGWEKQRSSQTDAHTDLAHHHLEHIHLAGPLPPELSSGLEWSKGELGSVSA